MLTTQEIFEAIAMLSEHVEGHNQTEMMHYAREKKWSEAELITALESIINIVKRRNN